MSRRLMIGPLALLVAMLALVAAGCGGSSKKGGGGGGGGGAASALPACACNISGVSALATSCRIAIVLKSS